MIAPRRNGRGGLLAGVIISGVILAIGLLVAFSTAASAVGSSSATDPPKPVSSVQNFGVGGALVIQQKVMPATVSSTGMADFVFQVTSGVSGPFAFSIAPQGQSVTPPQTLESTSLVPTYQLPAFLSVQFPAGNVVNTGSNATAIVNIYTHAAPVGHLTFEFVVFQQQSPVLMAETSIPITIDVLG